MQETDEALLERAIANNAAWCDSVCRAHGMAGSFLGDAWFNPGASPRYYPNVITMKRSAAATRVAELLARTSASAPSVKDSYGTLDLAGSRCELLFSADWVAYTRASGRPANGSPLTWTQLATEAELDEWTSAWADDPDDRQTFPAVLLRDPSITFWAGHQGDELLAGGITAASAGVIGLSNTFFRGEEERGLSSLVGAITDAHGSLPIVGYERGDALRAALSARFRQLGPLAVWVRS